MRFKVSVPGKDDKVVSIDGNESLLGELVQEIAEGFGITSEDIKAIRFGYPPQKVDVDEDSLIKPLEDIRLSSGEKISVLLSESANIAVSTNATPKARVVEKPLKDNQMSFYLNDGSKVILQQHQVPDDNSCLFHAISYCMYKDISVSYDLRKLVAKEIQENEITYNEAILGKKPLDYRNWILKRDSWGGGIEIAILSQVMNVAIYVLDMDAVKFEKFNEDKYDQFIVILFNGIHYDAMEFSNQKTVFDLKNDENTGNLVLKNSLEIARKLKQSGHAFNTHKAQIICNICRKTFVGERDVTKHAESTGHTDFGQTSS